MEEEIKQEVQVQENQPAEKTKPQEEEKKDGILPICGICKSVTISPVSTPCNHTFCLTCVMESESKEEEGGLNCPVCGQTNQGIRVRLDLQELVKTHLGEEIYKQAVFRKGSIISEHQSMLAMGLRNFMGDGIYVDPLTNMEAALKRQLAIHMAHAHNHDDEEGEGGVVRGFAINSNLGLVPVNNHLWNNMFFVENRNDPGRAINTGEMRMRYSVDGDQNSSDSDDDDSNYSDQGPLVRQPTFFQPPLPQGHNPLQHAVQQQNFPQQIPFMTVPPGAVPLTLSQLQATLTGNTLENPPVAINPNPLDALMRAMADAQNNSNNNNNTEDVERSGRRVVSEPLNADRRPPIIPNRIPVTQDRPTGSIDLAEIMRQVQQNIPDMARQFQEQLQPQPNPVLNSLDNLGRLFVNNQNQQQRNNNQEENDEDGENENNEENRREQFRNIFRQGIPILTSIGTEGFDTNRAIEFINEILPGLARSFGLPLPEGFDVGDFIRNFGNQNNNNQERPDTNTFVNNLFERLNNNNNRPVQAQRIPVQEERPNLAPISPITPIRRVRRRRSRSRSPSPRREARQMDPRERRILEADIREINQEANRRVDAISRDLRQEYNDRFVREMNHRQSRVRGRANFKLARTNFFITIANAIQLIGLVIIFAIASRSVEYFPIVIFCLAVFASCHMILKYFRGQIRKLTGDSLEHIPVVRQRLPRIDPGRIDISVPEEIHINPPSPPLAREQLEEDREDSI